MERDAKVYVAGHRGLVGSALVRTLRGEGFSNLLLRTRQELDLCRQEAVERFFREERPDYVFLAAAKVGGIGANSACGGDFILQNLLIQTHVLDCARSFGTRKLLFLGSSCIYPKFAPQPIREESFLDGKLERQGTVEELCAKYDKRRLLVRAGEPERLARALSDAFPGARIVEREGEAWICEERLKVSEVVAALERSGVGFEDIEIVKPSLELAFREVAS